MGKQIESFIEILDPNFINSDMIGDVGAEKVVTIKGFEEAEYFNQQQNRKLKGSSVTFRECLPLILNATNTKTLKRLFSPNEDRTENCVGHKVTLYVTTTKVAGVERKCIRIKEFSEIKCADCGKPIMPWAGHSVSEMVEKSKKNCGRALCIDCMKKEKEKQDNDK